MKVSNNQTESNKTTTLFELTDLVVATLTEIKTVSVKPDPTVIKKLLITLDNINALGEFVQNYKGQPLDQWGIPEDMKELITPSAIRLVADDIQYPNLKSGYTPEEGGFETPEDYRLAWRHVYSLVRKTPVYSDGVIKARRQPKSLNDVLDYIVLDNKASFLWDKTSFPIVIKSEVKCVVKADQYTDTTWKSTFVKRLLQTI